MRSPQALAAVRAERKDAQAHAGAGRIHQLEQALQRQGLADRCVTGGSAGVEGEQQSSMGHRTSQGREPLPPVCLVRLRGGNAQASLSDPGLQALPELVNMMWIHNRPCLPGTGLQKHLLGPSRPLAAPLDHQAAAAALAA